MSNFNAYFRCPCCNDALDDWEVSMYDIFGGMKEDCYNKSMEAVYENMDLEALDNTDLDLED